MTRTSEALRTLIAATIAILLALAMQACGDSGGGGADTGTDTGADTAATVWRTCARSCTAAADCCVTGGAACGEFPNNWECDGACMMGGCSGDAQCVTWATGLSLPGAAGYRCSPTLLYYEASICARGCTGAPDCCPSGTDCSSYPNRYECDGGACRLLGCTGDAECVTWATAGGAADPSLFECRTFGFSNVPACAKRCTATADCCPSGTCPGFPDHSECLDGHCVSTCSDDAECRAWATSSGVADPARYVCHAY